METISEFLEKIRKNDVYLIIAIFIIAFFFRFALHAVVPVSGDASFHYSISKYIADTGQIPSLELVTGSDPFRYPPVFHFLSAFSYKLTGDVTLISPIFGALAVVVFFLFVRKFFKKLMSPTTFLLIMFMPMLFYFSGIGYSESVLFFCAITAYYFYFSFIKSEPGKMKNYFLILTIIFSALSALSHYHGGIVILSIFIYSLFRRNLKQAFTILIISLLIASPWYIKNQMEYGNPIWPMLTTGNFPDAHPELKQVSLGDKVLHWFSPQKWKALFFDFWIGAPNSGEDIENNYEIGTEKIPGFTYIFAIWIILLIVLTILLIFGFLDLRNNEYMLLFIIATVLCIIPLTLLDYGRLIFTAMPLFVLSLAQGFNKFWERLEIKVVFVASIIAFIGVAFGYGMIYSSTIQPYYPYYDQIRNEIPDNALVFSFQPGEYRYYTGKETVGIENIPNRIHTDIYDAPDPSLYLKQNNVDYMCCDFRRYVSYQEENKEICDFFLDNYSPVLDYEENGKWGKCWVIE